MRWDKSGTPPIDFESNSNELGSSMSHTDDFCHLRGKGGSAAGTLMFVDVGSVEIQL
jgi:hypothetical protein